MAFNLKPAGWLLLGALLFPLAATAQTPPPLVRLPDDYSSDVPEAAAAPPPAPRSTAAQRWLHEDSTATFKVEERSYWPALLLADAASVGLFIAGAGTAIPALMVMAPLAWIIVPPIIHAAYGNSQGTGLSLLARVLCPLVGGMLGSGIQSGTVGANGFLGILPGLVLGGLAGMIVAMIIDYAALGHVQVKSEAVPRFEPAVQN